MNWDKFEKVAPWLIAAAAVLFVLWYRLAGPVSPNLATFPLVVPGLTDRGNVVPPSSPLSPAQQQAVQSAQVPLTPQPAPYLFGVTYYGR